MANNPDNLNRFQIIRKDARNSFVETKSDCFCYGKVHLEFSAYDASKPEGQRQTNHVHIYVDVPEFLHLTQEAMIHMRAAQQRQQGDSKPLYEHLGGTHAKRLQFYGKARPDGKSLSRIIKLILGQKVDYLFVADNGPGDADARGLIVPRFGKAPENHVSVGLSWRNLNELLLMTQVHYSAWLSAKYVREPEPDQNYNRG